MFAPSLASVAGLSTLRVGNTLQAALLENGWSMQQLADEIEHDVAAVRLWCADRVPMEVGTLVMAALILGAPLSRFLPEARP